MSAGGRTRLVSLLGAALLGVLLAWWWRGAGKRDPAAPVEPAAPPVAAAPAPPAPPDDAPPAPAPAPAPRPADDPLAEGDGGSWAGVDLEEVRRALPDNLYWQTNVPTDDQRELDRRLQERTRWNEEYGKVLSNTATPQEIEAYYQHRQRVSEDAIEFANYLLNHYQDQLPGKDVGLLELAIELHLARLEEIPRQMADAFQRHEAHEAARQAWLEEQAAFDDDPAGAPTP